MKAYHRTSAGHSACIRILPDGTTTLVRRNGALAARPSDKPTHSKSARPVCPLAAFGAPQARMVIPGTPNGLTRRTQYPAPTPHHFQTWCRK